MVLPMVMENSTLNRAHQEQRKAEALLCHKKFDECIECHRNAIDLLSQTCKLTENIRALESLNLQKEYHQKQIKFVNLKRAQQEYYIKSLEDQRRKISARNMEGQDGENLEAVFYRTFQVHDSLIEYLGKRGTGSDNDSLKSTSDTEEKSERAQIVGNKHPKDESQMIEELKVLSGQLRSTVQCLLAELDDRNKEIEKLKERITVLESEKEKAQSKNNSSLKVVTDSSGATSPYVFSPSSELSPDVIHETTALPSLAPLEMPNFDFLNHIHNSYNSSKK
ncbi:nuclear receptor-binding factor 2 [Anoplophora glabripennis]|uniref:nuclear receptor-binding factor 2 n=1 Tax=Anoplophora glabripennis TaxID=217634 RepID=UPI000874C7A0|nr:nuclear receptor-binding factor 2 [Anoplophora glabripennis]